MGFYLRSGHWPDGQLSFDFRPIKADLNRRARLIRRLPQNFPARTTRQFGTAIGIGKLNYYLPALAAEHSETIRPLEVGLNAIMRSITGAFKTTPIALLHAESGIPPIRILIDEAMATMMRRMWRYPQAQLIKLYERKRLRYPEWSPFWGLDEACDKIPIEIRREGLTPRSQINSE